MAITHSGEKNLRVDLSTFRSPGNDSPRHGPAHAGSGFTHPDRHARSHLVAATVGGFVIIGLEAASLTLFGRLTDDVLTPRHFAAFPAIAATYLALCVAMIAVDYAASMSLARASQGVIRATRTSLFSRILTSPSALFARHEPGDLLTRLDSDVEIAEARSISGVHAAATAAFQAVVFTVMLVALDPLLAGVCLAFAPVGLLSARIVSRRIAAIEEESRERASMLMDRAAQAFDAEVEVRSYGWAPRLTAEFDEDGAAAETLALRATRTRSALEGLNHLVEMAAALCVIGVGVWQLSNGQVSLGALLAFLGFLLELFGPLSELAGLVATFAAARVSSERVDAIIVPGLVESETQQAVSSTVTSPALTFDAVAFTHPARERPTLKGLSFSLPEQGLTAVTGPSGSGKSTLLRLVTGDLTPTSGTVTLGGHALPNLTPSALRDAMTFVPQHPTLFTESIAANVRRARPECTATELATALDQSGVSAFAHHLPAGFDTPVGSGGRALSGGQRQRIALARALLRRSPLLVLDEPTTGLDGDAARDFGDTLTSLAQDHAILLVTHDEALAARAERHIRLGQSEAGQPADGGETHIPTRFVA